MVDIEAWHNHGQVSQVSASDASSHASRRRTKHPSTADACGLGILLEAACLETLSLYHIAAYLARASVD